MEPGIPAQYAGDAVRAECRRNGLGGAGNTYFWIDPVRGVAGVVLAQILPFADPAVLELLWAFERGIYATM